MVQKIFTRIFILTAIAVLFLFPIKTMADACSPVCSVSRQTEGEPYTVRVNIEGKWYLITYNAEGYIINIAEDED
jgi:hypothetical protein